MGVVCAYTACVDVRTPDALGIGYFVFVEKRDADPMARDDGGGGGEDAEVIRE